MPRYSNSNPALFGFFLFAVEMLSKALADVYIAQGPGTNGEKAFIYGEGGSLANMLSFVPGCNGTVLERCENLSEGDCGKSYETNCDYTFKSVEPYSVRGVAVAHIEDTTDTSFSDCLCEAYQNQIGKSDDGMIFIYIMGVVLAVALLAAIIYYLSMKYCPPNQNFFGPTERTRLLKDETGSPAIIPQQTTQANSM